jgi:hypothetical protein
VGEKADSCIAINKALTIGYRNGGVAPQAFFLPVDEAIAVTYLKVFLSSSNVDLSHIPQESPFNIDRKMGAAHRPQLETWDTLELAIIQKMPGSDVTASKTD